MKCTLAEIATWVQGTVDGDPGLRITGAAPLGAARPGEITLVDPAGRPAKIDPGDASAAIVPRGLSLPALPTIQVADVHQAFATVISHFRPPRQPRRIGASRRATISPRARLADDVEVHPGATIADDVRIGAGSVIHSGAHVMAGCRLGKNVVVFPAVVLYENTVVGDRTLIHAGAVIGAYGFGYKPVEGRHQVSAQLGHVEIGADVEIGANTTIDRGTYGATTIGEGTKIDNQVMIAHNCRIGRHNMICSQVGIAGSTSTGDYVVMAGQAGVRDHVHIGDGAVLCAKAGIHNDVAAGVAMLGCPATPEREQKRSMMAFAKLPELRRQVRTLEATVRRLAERLGEDDTQAAA
jgi:UDP-3-O-[3-hydroxymyristoyl] glucosamine N-acyltransferase